jgi:hypothetical protein
LVVAKDGCCFGPSLEFVYARFAYAPNIREALASPSHCEGALSTMMASPSHHDDALCDEVITHIRLPAMATALLFSLSSSLALHITALTR